MKCYNACLREGHGCYKLGQNHFNSILQFSNLIAFVFNFPPLSITRQCPQTQTSIYSKRFLTGLPTGRYPTWKNFFCSLIILCRLCFKVVIQNLWSSAINSVSSSDRIKTIKDGLKVWNVSNSVSGVDRISLIGSLYRIISKALANRLKVVMREVVGDCQVWFVIDVWTLFTSSSIC